MFVQGDTQKLIIGNQHLSYLIENPNAPKKTFHNDEYYYLAKLEPGVTFTHPNDLLIQEDNTWGRYEVVLDNGLNSEVEPRYFYKNNIIKRTDTQRIENSEQAYESRIEVIIRDLLFNTMNDNNWYLTAFKYFTMFKNYFSYELPIENDYYYYIEDINGNALIDSDNHSIKINETTNNPNRLYLDTLNKKIKVIIDNKLTDFQVNGTYGSNSFVAGFNSNILDLVLELKESLSTFIMQHDGLIEHHNIWNIFRDLVLKYSETNDTIMTDLNNLTEAEKNSKLTLLFKNNNELDVCRNFVNSFNEKLNAWDNINNLKNTFIDSRINYYEINDEIIIDLDSYGLYIKTTSLNWIQQQTGRNFEFIQDIYATEFNPINSLKLPFDISEGDDFGIIVYPLETKSNLNTITEDILVSEQKYQNRLLEISPAMGQMILEQEDVFTTVQPAELIYQKEYNNLNNNNYLESVILPKNFDFDLNQITLEYLHDNYILNGKNANEITFTSEDNKVMELSIKDISLFPEEIWEQSEIHLKYEEIDYNNETQILEKTLIYLRDFTLEKIQENNRTIVKINIQPIINDTDNNIHLETNNQSIVFKALGGSQNSEFKLKLKKSPTIEGAEARSFVKIEKPIDIYYGIISSLDESNFKMQINSGGEYYNCDYDLSLNLNNFSISDTEYGFKILKQYNNYLKDYEYYISDILIIEEENIIKTLDSAIIKISNNKIYNITNIGLVDENDKIIQELSSEQYEYEWDENNRITNLKIKDDNILNQKIQLTRKGCLFDSLNFEIFNYVEFY